MHLKLINIRLNIIAVLFLLNGLNAQSSKYLNQLVDSIPNGKPVFVNFEVEKGYMATERIAISNDGKRIFYGVRNGYDSISKAHILEICYKNKSWSKPKIVFADSSGAPAFSKNEKVLYFQYDHPNSPVGIYSDKTKEGWTKPKRFLSTLKKSHYLQSPNKNNYYYSAGIKGNPEVQDIFNVVVSKSDTIIKSLNFNIKGDFIDFYVSQDESFLLLFINKKRNGDVYEFYGNTDMFISFKTNKGVWSFPKNMGREVNSVSPWNWGPYVTNDRKYLFFSSWPKKVGTYMIDFESIYKRLKP